MEKRKICIYTGTRAEYGLLKPLIDELKNSKKVNIQMIISGMHLSPEFGLTYKEIDTKGIEKVEKVEMLLSSDTPIGISKAVGLGIIGYSEILEKLKPDILVGLGDRFELLSIVITAMILRIPVAHLHGGESTEGLIDEPIRHSITKMSHIHFASTDEYRKRIIQLGENPKRVFNTGAIGNDNKKKLKLLKLQELEKELNFKFNRKTLLVTFHPVTLEKETAHKQFHNLIKAFDQFNDIKIIFTKSNSDTDGRVINKMIDEYVAINKEKAISFMSLGQLKYLSTMKYVKGVVGNSSSGIVEAPSFKIGTINIGDRQRGRIKAESVIECLPQKNDIVKAIKYLLSDKFQKKIKNVNNPYELKKGITAQKIARTLENVKLDNIIKKKFYNIKFNL